MTPHKFYNVTGEGAGGSAEDNIAAVALRFGVAANNTHNAVNILKAMRAYADQEVAQHECRRHLSPRDIISFWDEVLKKPILCPDESRYFEWCYWMLKNERPVHQIQLENEVDKVVYIVGDKRENGEIKSLHWRGNYWYCRNENGDGISINGPIKGDDYHRDRFQRKTEELPSPSPGLQWVKASERLPYPEGPEHKIPCRIHGFLLWGFKHWIPGYGYKMYLVGERGDYRYMTLECEWLEEFPSLPGEQEATRFAKDDMVKAWNAGTDNGDVRNDLGVSFDQWFGQTYTESTKAETGERVEAGAEVEYTIQGLLDTIRRAYPYLKDLDSENIDDRSVGMYKDWDLSQVTMDAKYIADIPPSPAQQSLNIETEALPKIFIRGRNRKKGDQQVPEDETLQKIRNWIEANKMPGDEFDNKYEIGLARASARIINMYHKSMEQARRFDRTLAERDAQIATLKESFKSSIYQHDQNMQIVKGERDELCDLLNILNEGYSDHFTKFLNDRIYEALNKFTNNTKGE